ncbi:hypothetical protein BDY19DRAFT_923490 [Irpex rosettiformis]|uniref:Uncharacterized protein n=1 Tax=Irpex rosettiformis TaxID=378272 RepID=A0ACB8UGJ5_9APHY|nr:hypothetical protein BDY19DRAFT_923490 [Irpex rosettiformis]
MPLRSAAQRLTIRAPRLNSANLKRLMSSNELPAYAHRENDFKHTQPPNPNWDLGQGIPNDGFIAKEWNRDLEKGWKSWKLNELPVKETYQLLTSAVVPRPIAFVASQSAGGVPNLAPMSYFNAVSANPPLLSISLTLSPRRPKNTRENILNTRQFTVNIISDTFVEAANACSVEAPAEIDEWIVSGLTPEPSESILVPRVQESAVSFECELYKHIDITALDSDKPTNTLILGLIKQVHVRKAVLSQTEDTVDAAKLRPVARLGGNTYVRLGDTFELGRPSWRAWQDKVKKMHEEKKGSSSVDLKRQH